MYNLNNKFCKIFIPSKNKWLYIKIINECKSSFSGIRLQQDDFNNKKFYLTDEKDKWHGIIQDGKFSKGRYIFIYQ